MRLLSLTTDGEFKLRSFEHDHPAYAILSHTWATDNAHEVTYEDLIANIGRFKPGYAKLQFCAARAQRDGLLYFWIDTCCINKRSESEVTESVNSMFRWYHAAARCYVYLADVPTGVDDKSGQLLSPQVESAMRSSRWFKRGWTLQELIAPPKVDFFARNGDRLGDKKSLEPVICDITNIPGRALRGAHLACFSIRERESWAAGRCTKREEDRVYSLFGLLEIYMPLIYGEGYANAYRRLEEEIDKSGRRRSKEHARSIDTYESPSTSAVQLHRQPLKRPASPLISGRSASGRTQSPMGFFEMAQSFRPCQYTCFPLGAQIVCYMQKTIGKTDASVKQRYDVLFALHQKNWIRLRVDVTVTANSPYFGAASSHAPSDDDSCFNPRQLPGRVISMISHSVPAEDDVADDAIVEIELGRCQDLETDESLRILPASLDTTAPFDKDHGFLNDQLLRHLHVRIIEDTELTVVFVHGVFWVAFLDGRWVRCTQYNASTPDHHQLQRSFRNLLRLRGARNCARLLGAIISSKSKIFKGFLEELPAKGPMRVIMDAARENGCSIPWSRKSRWARDIVRGVAEMHKSGVLVGGPVLRWNIGIDREDRASVRAVTSSMHPGMFPCSGLLPPECRNEAFRAGIAPVTPELDIFQLGLVLWNLYLDEEPHRGCIWCSLKTCEYAPRNMGEPVHQYPFFDPIALPKVKERMPGYLYEAIAACRQADPRMRPTAWQLLDMFPSECEHFGTTDARCHNAEEDSNMFSPRDSAAPKTCTSLEDLQRLERLHWSSMCDVCLEFVGSISYRCETCRRGNFDVCHNCFTFGKHCDDATHWLIQMRVQPWPNQWLDSKMTCFSAAKNGERRAVFI